MRHPFWLKNLGLILLAGAIALSPSFNIGTIAGLGKIIEIRAEDILFSFLIIIAIINFLVLGKAKIQKPPLFSLISLWLGIAFFSTLLNWLAGNLTISRGFFYFLKELEFFLIYFYVFYKIKNLNSAKFFVKFWFFLGLLNVIWVIYQIVFRIKTGHSIEPLSIGLRGGEYGGPSAIGEWGVFPTGAFFLLIFIFLFNIGLYYILSRETTNPQKFFLTLISIAPIIGIIGSASKTNFLGILIAIFLTFFFLFLKSNKIKTFILISLILFLISIVFVISFRNIPAADRIFYIFNIENLIQNIKTGRLENISMALEGALTKSPLLFFFPGFGKGSIGEAHSQYLRNFLETGFIGFSVFLLLIFMIIKKSWLGFSKEKNPLSVGLSAGLLVATLIMLFLSLTTEPFLTVKPAEIYWFFTAMTMSVLSF